MQIEKPIIRPLGLSSLLSDMMAETCPINAWCMKKDLERKNSKW